MQDETSARPTTWPEPRPLDFAVIGVIKGGTTTVNNWLRRNDRVLLPPGKEVNYFTRDDYFSSGWGAFAEEHYLAHDPPSSSLWGAVSPAYMADPLAAERIASEMPAIKLIAVLRHPSERAISEWQMMRRKGFEDRPLERALREQLDAKKLEDARARRFSPADVDSYVARGEYGRILRDYLRWFPRDRFLVLYTDDLAAEPAMALDRITAFVGLEPYRPGNLEKRYHVGGERRRFPNLLRRLSGVGVLRRVWRALPVSIRRDVLYYWHTEINVAPSEKPTIPSALRDQLRAHYRPDVQQLSRDFGAPPWSDLL